MVENEKCPIDDECDYVNPALRVHKCKGQRLHVWHAHREKNPAFHFSSLTFTDDTLIYIITDTSVIDITFYMSLTLNNSKKLICILLYLLRADWRRQCSLYLPRAWASPAHRHRTLCRWVESWRPLCAAHAVQWLLFFTLPLH